MSNVIHRQKLDNIKPMVWYGKPVYAKYKHVLSILSKRLGREYESFLLEPEISDDALVGKDNALWLSTTYNKLKPLNKFSKNIQDELTGKLKTKVDAILTLSKEFEQSDNEDEREFADFLSFVIEIPNLDYVYSNGTDICLACWGFKSIDQAKKNFKLSKTLEKPEVKQEAENNLDETTHTTPSKSTPIQNTSKTKVSNESNDTKWKRYFLILLCTVSLFLLIGLIYYFKDSLFAYKQDVTPIDPTKVQIDKKDPLKKKIVTNRLTVMLDMDNGVTIESFKTAFSQKFPDSGIKIVFEEPMIGLVEFEIPEKDRQKWIKDLESLKEVITAFVENVIGTSYIPNDKDFNDVKKKWLFNVINAYKGWDKTKGKEEIVIAVIDGAFDLDHPELKNKKIVKPWNAALGNNNLTTATKGGYDHGTHVATTATGSIDNNVGTGGLCPSCSLMPIQVGQKGFEGISSNAVVRGMLYAIKNNANVINLSLGKTYHVDFSQKSDRDKKDFRNTVRRNTVKAELKYERIFKLAREKNIAIVYASGNENMYSDIDPQKRSSDIIVVGAINPKEKRASFSNYGENVTICAPGVQIYSAIPNGKYKYLDGTSMASPIVAGLIGLMKSLNPSLPNDRIHEIILSTGKKIQTKNSNNIGVLIQVDKALQEAGKPYSLKNELKRLKEELKKCRNNKKKRMVIPQKKPKNFEFAEGIWKSSSLLYEFKNNKSIKSNPITLYFDINKAGSGTITLDLVKKADKCKAKIELAFNQKKLTINQLEKAKCSKSNMSYSKYKFDCISTQNEAAICKATGNNNFSFELIKQ